MRKSFYSFKLMAAAALALGLLLGSGTAQAAANVIFDPIVDGKAIGITGVDIEGTTYDVEFLESTTAYEVYGELPGDFDFSTPVLAEAAVNAVNAALTSNNVVWVGQKGGSTDSSNRAYAVGYDTSDANVWAWLGLNSDPWLDAENKTINYFGDAIIYAVFTLGANPILIGGNVIHLEGSGLQLQNNGGDTLDISGNGTFTFATPILTGETYNVTVQTDPSDPVQQCTVYRGSGIATTEDVTNVVVSCVPFEPLSVVRIFVTSTGYDGNLDGLAGGDAKCQEAADTAQLGGGPWTAWLSENVDTGTTNAIDRIPNGRYRLLNDTLIALDKNDLITLNNQNYLRSNIDIDEYGEDVGVVGVWTGTTATGLYAVGACRSSSDPEGRGWTGNTTEEQAYTGNTGSSGGQWTADATVFCDTLNRLYCFGAPEAAAAPAAAFLPGAVYLPLLLSP